MLNRSNNRTRSHEPAVGLTHGFGVILPVLFAVLVFAESGTAQPITRDDFVCADTSADSLGGAVWPSVAVKESGDFFVTYLRQEVTSRQALLRLFMAEYDRTGEPAGPEVWILPDTVGDSVRWPTSPTPLAVNRVGWFFFPAHTTINDRSRQTIARTIDYYVGSSLTSWDRSRYSAVAVPMKGNHYRPHMAVGAINASGKCGAAWIGSQVEAPYHAKLFVRMYDIATGEFGQFNIPSSRPLPPDLSGMIIERRPKGPPALAIADDGGFAVAWIGEGEKDARVFHCPYDASGKARGPVRIVDADKTTDVVVRTVNIDGESDGDYYLVWSTDIVGTTTHHTRTHVWMQGFNSTGTPKYAAVRVDDADSTNIIDEGIIYPSIACDDSGNVVVVWADARLHPDSHRTGLRQDVFAQRIKPDGSRVGANVRINNIVGLADLKGTHSDCDLNNDGQVVIVWRDFGTDNTIKAQLIPLDQVGRVIPGDLNSDFTVGGNDVRVLCDYLLGDNSGTFWPRSLADMNDDGRSDISDLLYLSDLVKAEK